MTTKTVELSSPIPSLVFSEYAWEKIRWFMEQAGKNEISGFGVTEPENALRIVDFRTTHQEVGGTETKMDDEKLALYVGSMAEKGIEPARCMRVWIHSHPFSSSGIGPSVTDENTFQKKIGEGDWGVMVIFGKSMETSIARLRSQIILPGCSVIDIEINVSHEVGTMVRTANQESWALEYKENIQEEVVTVSQITRDSWNNRYDWNRDKGEGETNRFLQEVNNSDICSLVLALYNNGKLPIEKFQAEWEAQPGTWIPLEAFTIARLEGYSLEQIETWDTAVFNQAPHKPTKLYLTHCRLEGKGRLSKILHEDTIGNLGGNRESEHKPYFNRWRKKNRKQARNIAGIVEFL